MKDREEAHCIHLIFRVELSFKDLYLPILSSKLASFENKRRKRRKNVEIFINSQLFFFLILTEIMLFLLILFISMFAF